MFKGAQFLSSGVFMACLAAFEYYMCVKPGGTHTCDTEGPGVSQGLVTSSVDFVGSCALVWLAFLLLPCTRSFAGAREITAQSDVKEDEQSGSEERCCLYDRSRGGRLAGLLGYDLFTFVLSCALIYVLTVLDVSKEATVQLEQVAINKDLLLSDLQNWQFRSRFFFGRIVYGLVVLSVSYLPATRAERHSHSHEPHGVQPAWALCAVPVATNGGGEVPMKNHN